MSVTTLNKIIALFLVGGVVVFLGVGLHWQQVKAALPTSSGESSVWVFLALLLVPASALIGAVVEGISEVTIRKFLKRARSHRSVARFFLQTNALRQQENWLAHLGSLVKGDARYHGFLAVDKEYEGSSLRATAAGFLLQTARPQNAEWLVQHYSTYVLASNLGLVSASAVVYVLLGNLASTLDCWWPVLDWVNGGQLTLLVVAGLVASWSLLSLSVGRYIYSYEVTARHMALCLADERLLWAENQ